MSDTERARVLAREVLEKLDAKLRAHLAPHQYTTAHFDFGQALIERALAEVERNAYERGRMDVYREVGWCRTKAEGKP